MPGGRREVFRSVEGGALLAGNGSALTDADHGAGLVAGELHIATSGAAGFVIGFAFLASKGRRACGCVEFLFFAYLA